MSDKIDQVLDLLQKVYEELKDTKSELKGSIKRIEECIENVKYPDIKTIIQRHG